MRQPERCLRCIELEDLVAALNGTAGFYWALWQEVQHVLAHFPTPIRSYSAYARWYSGPRTDALRGHDPGLVRPFCPQCGARALSLFRLPSRYRDPRPVCAACYLEMVGRSAVVGWRDDEPKL